MWDAIGPCRLWQAAFRCRLVRTHHAYRLYGPCGKRGWSRQPGCGGETTVGLGPDLVVSSLSILRASELCSTTPAPSRLKATIPATRARRRGRLKLLVGAPFACGFGRV